MSRRLDRVLLSFDVEDWFQVENLRSLYPPSGWDQQQLRVEIGTRRILEILRRHRVQATFFTLAWIAERAPQLIRDIVADGHELASHGSSHVLPTEQSPEQFRQDIRAAKVALEQLAGVDIRGYRAPSFAIDDARLKIVFEEGHRYDSSHNPFALHDRYGTLRELGPELVPGVRAVIGGGHELSMPLAQLGPLAIPVGGGGYFRLYPAPLFRALARRARAAGGPVVVYLHPWEFDPEQPRAEGKLSASHRFRHYQNLRRTAARLERFIERFQAGGATFQTMSAYLDELVEPARATG
jgi:polysaccharide deacetylase family protein (PEP-CTERM system associated)